MALDQTPIAKPSIVIDKILVGQRLDACATEQLEGYSRSSVAKLIDAGNILVNGAVVKSNYKVREDDVISFTLPTEVVPEIDLPIIFDNSDVIVIDKPAGVLTHSKGAFNPEGTVASFIASRINDDLASGGRGGIVHRLDRDTSGVILCAKNLAAQSFLQRQFSDRKVKKTYVAIVEGIVKDDEAILKWPIERNPKKPQTFRVGAHGKPAETHLKVLDRNLKKNITLVELRPHTGRTHQLRVHMLELGHPIAGDRFYGTAGERLWLHAQSLEITIPGGERKTFVSPLPLSFTNTFGQR